MISASQIIYDDKYICVVNKPHGLQTEPDRLAHPDLCTQLRQYLNKQNRPPKILHPVNRLDRPVAGLVLFAKTPAALKKLNEMQEKRLIKKTYTALVEGIFSEKKGTLQHFLTKHNLEKRAYVSADETPLSKFCKLDYTVLQENGNTSLLEIHLQTGRYHQIRSQIAFVLHPIIGDVYYGAKEMWRENSICLHASQLIFKHPISGEELYLHAPAHFS